MGLEVPILQLVAYSCLTLASVTVATVSAIFGYRSNYGWRPIALVTSHGLSGIGGSKQYNALLTIEFWNRRKYPVVLGAISVKFRMMEFIYAPSPNERGWSRSGDSYFNRVDERLEPAGHKTVEFSAPFETKSIGALRDTVEVTVHYFDPIGGKSKLANTKHLYTFQLPSATPAFAHITG